MKSIGIKILLISLFSALLTIPLPAHSQSIAGESESRIEELVYASQGLYSEIFVPKEVKSTRSYYDSVQYEKEPHTILLANQLGLPLYILYSSIRLYH